jgi:hypothetical protein
VSARRRHEKGKDAFMLHPAEHTSQFAAVEKDDTTSMSTSTDAPKSLRGTSAEKVDRGSHPTRDPRSICYETADRDSCSPRRDVSDWQQRCAMKTKERIGTMADVRT